MQTQCRQEIITGPTTIEVSKVIHATLGKDTCRCVEYLKAAILLSNTLHEMNADVILCCLMDAVVEICQLVYARECIRSPRAVLKLHNITFLHAIYCCKLFGGKNVQKRKCLVDTFHACCFNVLDCTTE